MLAEFLGFYVDDFLHECGEVIPSQVVDVVVPVVGVAVLLPLCELAGVDASEVAHVDVETELKRHIGKAVFLPIHNPSLSIIKDSVLKVNNVEGCLVDNSVKADNVAVFCLAVVLGVFKPRLGYKVSHGPFVHVLLHDFEWKFYASFYC